MPLEGIGEETAEGIGNYREDLERSGPCREIDGEGGSFFRLGADEHMPAMGLSQYCAFPLERARVPPAKTLTSVFAPSVVKFRLTRLRQGRII